MYRVELNLKFWTNFDFLSSLDHDRTITDNRLQIIERNIGCLYVQVWTSVLIIINYNFCYYYNQEWMIYQRKKLLNRTRVLVTALSANWSAPQLNRIGRKSSKNRKCARGRYPLTRWYDELQRRRPAVDRFWSVGSTDMSHNISSL